VCRHHRGRIRLHLRWVQGSPGLAHRTRSVGQRQYLGRAIGVRTCPSRYPRGRLMTLKEQEIRPEHLKAAQLERFAADINRLLSRKNEFVDVACPACGSKRSTLAFQKYELHYNQCSHCETVYVSPRPTPEILEEYYRTSENYQYWNTHIFPASEPARREKIFKPRAQRLIDLCKKHRVKPGTLIEVGAGFGTFCESLLES